MAFARFSSVRVYMSVSVLSSIMASDMRVVRLYIHGLIEIIEVAF